MKRIGVNIVKRALEEPTRKIAHNSGHEGAVVGGRVRESKDENFGYNAETGEFGDMVEAGVIDPAKVTANHRSPGSRPEGRGDGRTVGGGMGGTC